jgi:hypothetical protein
MHAPTFEDLSLNPFGGVAKWLIQGAFIVAVVWGIVTQSSQNASALFLKEMAIITPPMQHYLEDKLEIVTDAVLISIENNKQRIK